MSKYILNENYGITTLTKWRKGDRKPERVVTSLDEAEYIKNSLERADHISYVIFDIDTKKIVENMTELYENDGNYFFGLDRNSEEADDLLFGLQVLWGDPKMGFDDFSNLAISESTLNKAKEYAKKYDKFTYFEPEEFIEIIDDSYLNEDFEPSFKYLADINKEIKSANEVINKLREPAFKHIDRSKRVKQHDYYNINADDETRLIDFMSATDRDKVNKIKQDIKDFSNEATNLESQYERAENMFADELHPYGGLDGWGITIFDAKKRDELQPKVMELRKKVQTLKQELEDMLERAEMSYNQDVDKRINDLDVPKYRSISRDRYNELDSHQNDIMQLAKDEGFYQIIDDIKQGIIWLNPDYYKNLDVSDEDVKFEDFNGGIDDNGNEYIDFTVAIPIDAADISIDDLAIYDDEPDDYDSDYFSNDQFDIEDKAIIKKSQLDDYCNRTVDDFKISYSITDIDYSSADILVDKYLDTEDSNGVIWVYADITITKIN